MEARSEFKFMIKYGGEGAAEFAKGVSHQDAAERFIKKIARRDFGSRSFECLVKFNGETEDKVNWWRGELRRRAKDNNGWISVLSNIEFTTRKCN